MKFYSILLITGCLGLFGCQSFDSPDPQIALKAVVSDSPEQEFDNKLSALVDDLVASENFDYQNKPILMTTFVWADTLTYKSSSTRQLKMLGHHVSEGVMTKLVQRGGHVIEYLTAKTVSVSKNASYFLTRDIAKIKSTANAHYIIAGTVTEVDNGAIVNVEVIELSTRRIVSASRQYFANDYLWREDKMTTTQHGFLYRK